MGELQELEAGLKQAQEDLKAAAARESAETKHCEEIEKQMETFADSVCYLCVNAYRCICVN